MPLAVVGSNVVIEVNGKKVRGRQYPWGVAEGRSTQTRWQRKNTTSILEPNLEQEHIAMWTL